MKLIFLCIALLVSGRGSAADLATVPSVDLKRYLGVWYEVASFPGPHQTDCVATQATYKLRDDGDIDILNECREKTLDGKPRQATGKAWVVDKATNAKLKVRFFWPFTGDYWVIDLGKDYEYAVVSEPRRKYLWILSRRRQMAPDVYEKITSKLKADGFDLSRLDKTPQPTA